MLALPITPDLDSALAPYRTAAAQDIIDAGKAPVSHTHSYNDLTNKPTLGTAAATDVTSYATAAQGTKADTALQAAALTPYRTSSAQDIIDAGKAPVSHTHTLSNLTQSSATNGQVPTWNGSAWVPQTPASGGNAIVTALIFG